MERPAFLQREIDRIVKAAVKNRCIVQVDLKNLVVQIFPPDESKPLPGSASPLSQLRRDGNENWDD